MQHLDYIIEFFSNVPDDLLPVKAGIIMLNRQGIDCHIATCKANEGAEWVRPYYERLIEAGRRVKEKMRGKTLKKC
jgi:hypothetical protein